jgi:hypothetical protein
MRAAKRLAERAGQTSSELGQTNEWGRGGTGNDRQQDSQWGSSRTTSFICILADV